MTWLGQNWLWIVLAIGAFFLMTRMGGCGMGRSRASRDRDDGARDVMPPSPGNRRGTSSDPVARYESTANSNLLSTVR